MHCEGLAENIDLLTLYVYPFLILFIIWNIVSNNMSKRVESFI